MLYFKIKDKVIFRNYGDYGYLADNSMFGYQFLNEDCRSLDEKYISQTGAIMIDLLSKIPQKLETVVSKLHNIFVGVEFEVLRQDTEKFFMGLVKEGYLSCGETIELCNDSNETVYSLTDKVNNVLKSNSYKSFNDNMVNSYILKRVHVDITTVCNEKCLHCYIPHKFRGKNIYRELFFKVVDDGLDANILNLTISGGEPLLHPDIICFLRKCRQANLSINILSNLTVLNDDILDEMKKNPLLSVQTSIYSTKEEVHDLITQVNGSLERTSAAVLKLLTAKIPVQISCPVMKQNKDDFVSVVKWGEAHNIYVNVNPVIFATYDHKNTNLINRLSIKEIDDVFNKQMSRDYVAHLKRYACEKSRQTGNDPICSVCRDYFCVSADGNVFPCVGWNTMELGNICEQSIKEIWENSKKIKYLRGIQRKHFPQCVDCEDRGYCTVCMMINSNENSEGNMFTINTFHCDVAKQLHIKSEAYR